MKNKTRRKKTGIVIFLCILFLLVSAAIGCTAVFGNEIGIIKLFKDWDRAWNNGNYEECSDLWLAGFDSNPSESVGDDDVRIANAGIVATHKIDSCKKLTYGKFKKYLPKVYNIPQSFERLKPDASYIVTCTTTINDEVKNTEDVSTGDMLVIKYNGKWYLGSWIFEADEWDLGYNP